MTPDHADRVPSRSIDAALGCLDRRRTVSLQELDRVRLLDRAETKVLLPLGDVTELLQRVADQYFTLEIDGGYVQRYRTEYFDSHDFSTYHDHHNRLGRRFKARYRTYVDSGMTFFELKRNVRGRIIKERQRSSAPFGEIWDSDVAFARRHGIDLSGFRPSVTVEYDRLLLARLDPQERVTIDVATSFRRGDRQVVAAGLAICEFKQPRVDRSSPAMSACRELGHRPRSMSKYCTGVATCHVDVKRNRFLPTFRHLIKLGTRFETNGEHT